MKITELRLDVAKTVNLGNFESVRLAAGVTVAVAEGEDVATLRAEAHEDLRDMLNEAWRAHGGGRG